MRVFRNANGKLKILVMMILIMIRKDLDSNSVSDRLFGGSFFS